MKIIFVSDFSVDVIQNVPIIPRVGDNVILFYSPSPTVIRVDLCIDKNMCNCIFHDILIQGSTIPNFPKDFSDVDAIVRVK